MRLRRPRSLALRLEGERLVAEDCLSGRRHAINEDALSLLRRFSEWRSAPSVAADLADYDPASVEASIHHLAEQGLLVKEGTRTAARDAGLEAWDAWGPAATSFHFTARHSDFATTDRERERVAAVIARDPMPAIYKDLPGRRHRLPAPAARLARKALGRVLLERRTCRTFRRASISRQDLDAIVALSFGRLGFVDGGPFGTLLLRSTPSGGARHAIECYVMALRVRGLPRGLYHYSVRENALVELGRRASERQLLRFTWNQRWFAGTAAVFLLTAVVARSQWKYRNPRAYRVLLLDAGHACQNLLLAATARGVGAFCTAALDEPAIDRYLGLDGVREGILYLAGIGVPDEGARAVRE